MKIATLGISLGIVCLLETGCAIGHYNFDPIQDAFDDWDYKDSVKYYESRGQNDKDAKRAAYEDQFFKKMEQEH